MPNVGVYIGQELHDRLGRLKEQGNPVNVSAVCQQALEKHVDMLEGSPTLARRERIVARLRDSRTPEQRSRLAGHRAGRTWAEELGAWDDVRTVQGWTKVSREPYYMDEDGPVAGYFITIDGKYLDEKEGFPSPADHLEEPYRQDTHHMVHFWVGFIEGVSEVYQLVHDALEPDPEPEPDDIPF